uniref:hypothetical protein n=1 Tax=Streptococcus pneumoniae TaxID=1313 RepID=UPI000A26E8D1
MLNAKIFYIFLCLIVIETTGLLLLKRGLEMGYLDTEAIILAVFSFAFYNLCSFAWVCLLYTSPSPRDQRGSRM